MAKAAGVTTWQVRQVWEAADLKPHRLKTFKISNDPEFAEKVIDVVGLYITLPTMPLSCRWTRKPGFKLWIAPNRCFL